MDTTFNYMRFEKVSKYQNDPDVRLPQRKTVASAGYDFYVAEDIIIPSYNEISYDFTGDIARAYDLEHVASMIKAMGRKVTLVPTGVKACMPENWYLQLSVRSSLSLKHWLILGNGVGIIDADYYNNPDNEGHIFFQIINLLPCAVQLHKGDCIGQGVFLNYGTTIDDDVTEKRMGGFGSTDK